MKRLTILRHAKSSWDDASLDDFNRPLNARGWKDARRVGKDLKRRGVHFDLCVASTAARVRETLDGLVEGYGKLDFEIRFEPRIYEASLATLLEVVRGLEDSSNAPLLVGHNPGLQQLVLELARDDAKGLRKRASIKFPTAALALIEMHVDRWANVRSGSSQIAKLIFPKDLD
ncbi:MAG TPA: histidine phosphatase family protein [Sphingomicrobium sp.]|jgi:phosphohistidine phosphatase|nr:histidine phosphatase family protein [Sphingomicrobium sp.]